MPVRTEIKKPQIELLPFITAKNPSRNYVYNLLYRHIEQVTPERSIDAGCGELRNRWMFPGTYLGITDQHAGYFKGLIRVAKSPLLREGEMTVYLMRLEGDFSFLAPVDLAVCTYTMAYIEDCGDLARRLADCVNKGGSIFLQGDLKALDAVLHAVEPLFDDSQVVYTGTEGLNEWDFSGRKFEMTRLEMRMPNRAEGHEHFTLIARGKRHPAVEGRPPELIDDRGLKMVKRDLPFLCIPTETPP
jgi:hypothetical protein